MKPDEKVSAPHRPPILAQALAATYLLALAGVLGTAVALWRTYCEGFGCTGLGIAWMAWAACLYLPTLALGLWSRAWPSSLTPLAGAVRACLVVQMMIGCALAIRWAAHAFV